MAWFLYDKGLHHERVNVKKKLKKKKLKENSVGVGSKS